MELCTIKTFLTGFFSFCLMPKLQNVFLFTFIEIWRKTTCGISYESIYLFPVNLHCPSPHPTFLVRHTTVTFPLQHTHILYRTPSFFFYHLTTFLLGKLMSGIPFLVNGLPFHRFQQSCNDWNWTFSCVTDCRLFTLHHSLLMLVISERWEDKI